MLLVRHVLHDQMPLRGRPHPWNVDFPHLMLRAKAVKNRNGGTRLRDRVLSSTGHVGKLAGIPVVAEVVNAVNRSSVGRKVLDAALGVHPEAPVPPYRSQHAAQATPQAAQVDPRRAAGRRHSRKVALFATCYGKSQRAADRPRSCQCIRA